MPLAEGEDFAGYTILRRLGAGGMGEVYLVQHPRLPRREALKVLPAELTHDLEYTDRFAREADIVSTLWHPNIVALHDRGEFDGQLWISMDFVDGTDAAHLLQEHPHGLPPQEVVRIVTGIADALDYAHDNDMLHRDVKPANILIAGQGSGSTRALLADFGIARRVDDPGTLTATNMTVGTVAYAAPEQLMGQPLDGRADQYALAATAFHLLTGLPLYQHTNPAVVISQHLTAPPPAIEDRRPELSALGPVFAKALAKSPEDRYVRCADFARAFAEQLQASAPDGDAGTPAALPEREAGHTEPTVAAKIAKPTHRRRKQKERRRIVVPAIVAGLVIVVAAVAAIFVLRDRSSSPDAPPEADASIAATVPEDIKSTGHLVVGVNVPYSPMEFKNASGEFDGFDIDLMNAVARTLGLTVEYREMLFTDLIPQVQTGEIDVGLSSITDTKAREATVDFVTYFQSGTLWAQRAGSEISPDRPCGVKVGVKAGTVQATMNLPAKSNMCVSTGLAPLQVVEFQEQDDVTKALIAEDVDAMSADSPVTLFAIKLSAGALVPAGEIFSPEPYGWPVAKGSRLAESLRQALEHLIKTGEYRTIAAMWGLEKGMIDQPVINGAIR